MSKNETFMENNNSNSRIPKLRFPGFTGEWEERSFGELYKKHIVKNDLSFGVDKIISVANMYFKNDANVSNDDYLRTYNVFRLGDIAYEGNKNANYAYGRFVENTIGDGIVSHVFDVYSPISPNHCLAFWKYAINYERIMRPVLEKSTIKSTMMTNLIAKDFLKQKILVPPTLAEQQKIASCLSELDNLISAQDQKVDALKEKKKGLMQQLFPQPGETIPRLRFPGFTGDWEEKKMGKVFSRITRKNAENNQNVLTISAQYGLISQLDFFKKSVAAADVTGYYLLYKGEFAYNKSSSQGKPVGAIKPLKLYDKGVVSTLYICFKCNDPREIDFWEQYFDAGILDNEIMSIAQEGARNHGLLNIPTSGFFELSVIAPTLTEMQKIAGCLSSLDDNIAAEAAKLDALKNHKKGLMQQLFPQPAK